MSSFTRRMQRVAKRQKSKKGYKGPYDGTFGSKVGFVKKTRIERKQENA